MNRRPFDNPLKNSRGLRTALASAGVLQWAVGRAGRANLLLAPVLLAATGAVAQTTRPAPPAPPAARPLAAPAPRLGAGPSPAGNPAGDARPQRAPLLREGSHLVRANGRLRRAADDGSWVFTVDATIGGSTLSPELTLLPDTLLGEMEHMLHGIDVDGLVFEITGAVFVYQDRNYLALTHPALLIGREEETPEAAGAPTAGASGDSTDDIIRDLERSVGPVVHRPAAEWSPPAAEVAPGHGAALIAEGTTVLARRGRIRRTGAGTFMFVFDADAEGLADPPMILLPCLLLERLEAHARHAGERTPVLISGRVHTYRGQNYLRPTLFRIPRERTLLTP